MRSSGCEIDLEPAGLDALALEEVIDQRVEAVSLLLDDLEVVRDLRLLEVALQEQARVAEDARQRVPQLVRDDADELRLEPLALAQLLVLELLFPPALLERPGHHVERARERMDLGRALLGQPRRQVARGDAGRAVRDGPDRSGDPARQEDPVQREQPGGADEGRDADLDRLDRLALCLGGVGRRERRLAGEEVVEPPADRGDAEEPFLGRDGRPGGRRLDLVDRDQRGAVFPDVGLGSGPTSAIAWPCLRRLARELALHLVDRRRHAAAAHGATPSGTVAFPLTR